MFVKFILFSRKPLPKVFSWKNFPRCLRTRASFWHWQVCWCSIKWLSGLPLQHDSSAKILQQRASNWSISNIFTNFFSIYDYKYFSRLIAMNSMHVAICIVMRIVRLCGYLLTLKIFVWTFSFGKNELVIGMIFCLV